MFKEALPEGWSCVRTEDRTGVYYWNEATDQTTWLKPIADARASVAHAAEVFDHSEGKEDAVQFMRKSMSAAVLVGEGSAAGGAKVGVWPPKPEREAGQRCAP